MKTKEQDIFDIVLTALNDWMITYAIDQASDCEVKEAKERIGKNGGTLLYIADLKRRVSLYALTKETERLNLYDTTYQAVEPSCTLLVQPKMERDE